MVPRARLSSSVPGATREILQNASKRIGDWWLYALRNPLMAWREKAAFGFGKVGYGLVWSCMVNISSVFAIEPHFVRKGCAGSSKITIFPQFFAMEPHFVRNGCAGSFKITFFPSVFAIEPRFVRKGCISWRLVDTAPRLKREIDKKEREEDKRARGQDGKRARGQEGKI